MSGAEMTVVMPAHNESGAIGAVVASWHAVLERLQIDYVLRIYDDGSTDATPEILRELTSSSPRLQTVRQTNRGHGPTLVRAYGEAEGDWVFQTDADGEISASDFPRVWAAREGVDLVIGHRCGRRALFRRAISALARLTVRLAFGAAPSDVNCPYRLIRRERLQQLLPSLPANTFAPNVALAGLASRAGWRVIEVPVERRPRLAGRSSLAAFRLGRAALLAGVQTFAIARRAARRPPELELSS